MICIFQKYCFAFSISNFCKSDANLASLFLHSNSNNRRHSINLFFIVESPGYNPNLPSKKCFIFFSCQPRFRIIFARGIKPSIYSVKYGYDPLTKDPLFQGLRRPRQVLSYSLTFLPSSRTSLPAVIHIIRKRQPIRYSLWSRHVWSLDPRGDWYWGHLAVRFILHTKPYLMSLLEFRSIEPTHWNKFNSRLSRYPRIRRKICCST